MKRLILYIGKKLEQLEPLRASLEVDVEAYGSYSETIGKQSLLKDKGELVFLCEKQTLSIDQKGIAGLNKAFPDAYLVLVTDNLNDKEKKVYLNLGICNTNFAGPQPG